MLPRPDNETLTLKLMTCTIVLFVTFWTKKLNNIFAIMKKNIIKGGKMNLI